MRNRTRSRFRTRVLVGLGLVTILVLAAGLYWFQPWRLFTTTVVHDQLPVLAAEQVPAQAPTAEQVPAQASTAEQVPATGSSAASPSTRPTARPTGTRAPSPSVPATAPSASPARTVPAATTVPPTPPAGPVELARGTLISHEHDTSGTARLVELADGSRVLTLEGLHTSDGPALHVWLSDAPVIDGEDGWHVFDDGRHVDLGALKGNVGDQVYPVPAGLDLDPLTSVSIWCQRFSVSFGAAELTRRG